MANQEIGLDTSIETFVISSQTLKLSIPETTRIYENRPSGEKKTPDRVETPLKEDPDRHTL